jgi:hypothetical protein
MEDLSFKIFSKMLHLTKDYGSHLWSLYCIKSDGDVSTFEQTIIDECESLRICLDNIVMRTLLWQLQHVCLIFGL